MFGDESMDLALERIGESERMLIEPLRSRLGPPVDSSGKR
jgi:hypothetical protein